MSKRLGRGLDALIPSMEIDEGEKILEIDINRIRPNPYQPRKFFNESQLTDLMASIKEHGVIQAIIVRESLNGYEIIAGERRWRASKSLELSSIPAVVKDFTDQQVMEVALIENLQREDLNAVEIAHAYKKIMDCFNLTQVELAERIGVSRPNVANIMRLLQLPESIIAYINSNQISMGHARAIITLDDENKQLYYAKLVVKENWSVRTLEEKIKTGIDSVPRETNKKKQRSQLENKSDKDLELVEDKLREKLKTSVKIKPGKKKSKIEIEYFNNNDLERIINIIGFEKM